MENTIVQTRPKNNRRLRSSGLKCEATAVTVLAPSRRRESYVSDGACHLEGDLLVAVRVANEFKTDCQIQLGITEDYVKDLEQQICLLKSQIETGKEPTQDKRPTDDKKPSAKELGLHLSRELPVKKTYSRPSTQCVSVKSLIESIEKNASKQTKPAWIESQSGSTLTSPQRETAPAPLRDLQVTSNKQKISDSIVEPEDKEKSLNEKFDPLDSLTAKKRGSKRNALLKWCQVKTENYANIDITNFSSSWSDGLALCALLHTYLPDKVPYDSLSPSEHEHNFQVAFSTAESVGIPTILDIHDMAHNERPDWQKVIAYVKEIYKHFES
ncbi:cell division [Homalodisca vitripennis]|nr:cell division [Homalodisca vitripennis]